MLVKHLTKLSITLFIASTVLFSGCLGVKNSTGNSGIKLFETFYVGNDGTQYFIKPLIFKSINKNQLKLDITFRYKDNLKDSALINVSLINTMIFHNIDSLEINNDSVSIKFKNFRYLFAERTHKKFTSRFSAKGSLSNTNELFNKNNWNITIYSQDKEETFHSNNGTKKKIEKLNYSIFKLF